ncbi:MAG: hypothetical protein AUJ48_00570 [Deltaproteobacteria bacterium CG1_02_45_11]|nr:MAG: hypothetical protein AUJ48_00570 [Deltaproteobacteria bacterium CG1_02_45_11]
MNARTECAKCAKFACYHGKLDRAPEKCPIKTEAEIIDNASDIYNESGTREFARMASVQEFEGYMNLPEGRTPINTRVEEVAQFSKKMGYKRLGIAFCFGLRQEALILTEILENRGFEVVSVCCKVGSVPKETIGIKKEQKIYGPDSWESMCNPIAQAKILNAQDTDFNIAVGLCVGHDSLFFKHADALTTVLVAKDRVLGHNPAAGLYLATSYYRKLRRKE